MRKQSIDLLQALLALPGPSGNEGPVLDFICKHLVSLGVNPSRIFEDSAHRRCSGFSRGNLIVKFPGRAGRDRILFSAHTDTVPICTDAKPIRKNNRIVPAGNTGLGADNRTGVAVLLVLADFLLHHAVRPPPITMVFTVGEEVGLRGAQELSLASLGRPVCGFNFDGGDPARIVIGAIGSDRLNISIHGRSAHAGMHPEDGVSAGIIASKALSDLEENGWHGKIRKGPHEGSSNLGSIHGGVATNQVMDFLTLTAEARSHRLEFLDRISKTWERAFIKAAKMNSASGDSGHVDVDIQRQYLPFRLRVADPVVQQAKKAVQAVGLQPQTVMINGGLDANPLNAKGLPVVTLGAGQHGAHTLQEYADIEEFLKGCELACAICSQA